MLLPVYSASGEEKGTVEVSDFVFGVPFHEACVHQAMVRQLANARQGTAATKTRGMVSGSTRKLYAQKHTGRARAGSRHSPVRRGGGVAFGPQPRDYRQAMPKKMRRLAIRSLLSEKASSGAIKVLQGLGLKEVSTNGMAKLLSVLNIGKSVILATQDVKPEVVLSARNLPGVKVTLARLLNVVDLLSYDVLILTDDAVHQIENTWGERG
jgi:large subunit ribosomal protein L4